MKINRAETRGLPRRFVPVLAIIALAIVLAVISILKMASSTALDRLSASGTPVRHTNAAARYSLMVPPKWYVYDLPNGNHGDLDIKSVIESPYSSVRIEIAAKQFSSPNIEAVIVWGDAKKKLETGYEQIDRYVYTTPQYSGIVEEYSEAIFGVPTKLFWNSIRYECISFYTLQASQGYDFSFCAAERLWSVAKPLFIEQINTIQFQQ